MGSDLNATLFSEPDPLDQTKIAILVTLLIGTIVCNILSLYVLVCRKPTRPSVKFIYGVCFKNLLLGSAVIVMFIVMTVNASLADDTSWRHCSAILFVTYILISAWSVSLISFDRYFAIRRALQYGNWFTNRTCVISMLLMLVIGISLSSLQAVNGSEKNYQPHLLIFLSSQLNDTYKLWTIYTLGVIFVGYILPFLANCIIYGSIYVATKNTTALARRNSIQPLLNTSVATLHNTRKESLESGRDALLRPRGGTGLRRLSGQLKVHKDNRKAAKMGALVILDQLLIRLPFYTLVVLQTYNCGKQLSLDWLTVVVALLDGITNPIIYVLRNKSSKAIILSIFGMQKKELLKHPTVQTQSTILKQVVSQLSDESI